MNTALQTADFLRAAKAKADARRYLAVAAVKTPHVTLAVRRERELKAVARG